ncbi:MAG: Rho termination factor N-terminal domain-containing protein [Rhodothermales bacterium]|nr:Rho termination factor N-terminal domain-containing protein [Rhodothermales bacterium]
MADDHYDEKYTKPALRREIKEELMQSDKGGAPGEWSARKSQLLAQEYERRGGGYKGEKDERQRSLEDWTDQDWQAQDGSADARRGGTTKRYLPEDAWALLPERARRKAEETKRDADDAGEQHADWPEAVHRVMAELGHADGPGLTKEMLYDRARELDVVGRSDMTKDELKGAILEAYRSRGAGLAQKTKEELYDEAQDLDVEGRSDMTKDELVDAIRQARS